jgi:hypothetical protein
MLLPSVADLTFMLWALLLPFVAHQTLLNSDGDLARHLYLGERMLREGSLLRFDSFSFTKAGETFLPFEYGSAVAYALAYRLGGLPAIAILAGILIALTYALVVLFLRQRGVDPTLAMFVGLVAAVTGKIHWLARPHLFTFIGAVLLLFLLERSGKQRLWLFVPLFAIWANLHGGFSFGLVLIGIYLAGSLAEGLFGREKELWWANARYYAQALGISVAACLINPFGYHLLTHVADFIGGQTFIKQHTNEFFSPNFHQLEAKLFLATVLLVVGLLIVNRQRPTYPRLLVILAGIAFALIYQRNIALFGLTVLPLAALQFDAAWREQRVPGLSRVRRIMAEGDAASAVGPWSAAATMGLILLALNGGVFRGASVIPPRFDTEVFPVEAVERARAAGLEGRIFSEFAWGGYLLYAWPEQKVFIDGGTDFYGEDVMRAFLEVQALQPGWREALQRWDVSLALLTPKSPLAHELSREPGWSIWYCDTTAVFLRKGSRGAPGSGASIRPADGSCLVADESSVLGRLNF